MHLSYSDGVSLFGFCFGYGARDNLCEFPSPSWPHSLCDGSSFCLIGLYCFSNSVSSGLWAVQFREKSSSSSVVVHVFKAEETAAVLMGLPINLGVPRPGLALLPAGN